MGIKGMTNLTLQEEISAIRRFGRNARSEAFFNSLAAAPEPEKYVLSRRQKVEAVVFGTLIWVGVIGIGWIVIH
jgi:hypothetical protein